MGLLEKNNVAEFIKNILLERPESKAPLRISEGGADSKFGYVSSDDDNLDGFQVTLVHEDDKDDDSDGTRKSEIYVADEKSLTYDS